MINRKVFHGCTELNSISLDAFLTRKKKRYTIILLDEASRIIVFTVNS